MKQKLFFAGFLAAIVALFLYSFTQIDLSLTFSQTSIWQIVQKNFQYIGYFRRGISLVLFVSIILLLTIFYGLGLFLASKKKLKRKQVWLLILMVSALLFFSYNAFSYDLFNYIFDAKIVTHYHLNPYQYRALDFAGDPMLSFMHWVERTYPYGPVWLGLTIPLSFIGMNIFIITFYLFKLLMLASFLGSVWLVEKIAQKTKTVDPLLAMVFFALNPLIVIESLVSAHNDIVMMFFALFSVYLFVANRKVISLLSLLFSIGIKFATAFLLPAFAYILIAKKNERTYERFFLLSFVLLSLAVVAATLRTNFQPWYLVYPMSFAPFLLRKYYIFILSFVVSIFSLFQYAPYIFLGNWDPPVPFILNTMLIVSLGVSGLFIMYFSFRRK